MVQLSPTKSPLRYPGGKSRALKQILPLIPEFEEFREPMVGGGAVFFALKQLHPDKKFWINDFNKELYLFWKFSKEELQKVIGGIVDIKGNYREGKELYSYLLDDYRKFSELQRAIRFFILNRITFSGLTESGGYSKQAFEKRFTDSSIERLKSASEVLQGTMVTGENYKNLIEANGENVFIFLDPPYLSKTKSRLYGRNGEFHTGFNHEEFAETMKNCKHKFLITYDDCQEIRELFKLSEQKIYIYEWELQYGMNNYKQKNAAKGKELFISNFKIPSLENLQLNKGRQKK